MVQIAGTLEVCKRPITVINLLFSSLFLLDYLLIMKVYLYVSVNKNDEKEEEN
jgi:hypothetical protein